MDRPLVTIHCTVYNHAKYLRDALEGFVSQKTDFKYNIFVYDDASTDGSSDILREYAAKYPGIFDICISPVNTFGKQCRNRQMLMLESKYLTGKYVAICEGDDYWTDENKLQMQVDYLESHPDATMCVHASIWEDLFTGSQKNFILYDKDCDIPAEEIIAPVKRIPRTASFVIRRELYDEPRFGDFPKADCWDLPILMYASMFGKIHYINREMSVYRCGTENSWSKKTVGSNRGLIKNTFIIFKYLEECYKKYGKYKDAYIERLNRKLIYSAWHERNLSYEEWEDAVKSVSAELGNVSPVFVDKLRTVHHIYCDGTGLDDDEMEMLKQCDHILIFGTGDYAEGALTIIRKNALNGKFAGYLVSKKNAELFNDKPIWPVSDYPMDKEKTGVIVGVGSVLRKEVGTLLEELSYRYVAPFWKNFWGDNLN